MNKRAYIAGEIERNRVALLRMVFCWLAATFLFGNNPTRKLPRRLSAYVEELMWMAEKSTENLLIALFYNNQARLRLYANYDRAVTRFIAINRTITLEHLTIGGIILRLQRLQHTLLNLDKTVRSFAKSVAAKGRIEVLKSAISFHGNSALIEKSAPIDADNFLPP